MLSLKQVADYLRGLGLNVVWVGPDKKPLGPWTSDPAKEPSKVHPEEPPPGAAGVAVTGWHYADPAYRAAVLDVDDPDAVLPRLEEAVGLEELCGRPWSLCGLTGPRPKGQVACEGGMCRMPDGSAVPASQVKRGAYIIVLIPTECAPRSSMRLGAVEVLVNNYQVVYGQHPSGLRYEFARYVDGALRPLGEGELPGAGVKLTCDQWRRIEQALKPPAAQGGAPTAQITEPPCIRNIEELGLKGELRGHEPWLIYASYWNRVGLWLRGYKAPEEARNAPEEARREAAEETIERLRRFPQFDEREARYQVEHLLGLRGGGKVYLAPSCARIQAAGLCVDSCPLKGLAKSPLAFLARRPVMLLDKGDAALPVYRKGDLWYAVKRIGRGAAKRIRLFQGDITLKKVDDSVLKLRMIYVEVRRGRERWTRVYTEDGDFVEDFSKNAPGILNETYARAFARALLNATPVEEGTLVVGITEDGAVSDPFGLLDKAVYRPDWLPRLAEWIRKYYGPNADYFLALVAIDLAKLIAPVVKRRTRGFADAAVYMYSEGGQGKTSFLRNVLLPINGGEALAEVPVYLSYLAGAVQTEAQMRALISLNSLPLLLDEQVGEKLERNAPIIIPAVTGEGAVAIHAPRYGLDAPIPFRIMRGGPIIATNTPFADFARRVLRQQRMMSSGAALSRRFIVMELDRHDFAAAAPKAAEELEAVGIRPALGLMAELARRRRFRARNVLELAQQVMEAIAEEYGVDASPYLKALERVREAQRELKADRDDADVLRDAIYEALEELGVMPRSLGDVVGALWSNQGVLGVEFIGAQSYEEEEEAARRIEELPLGIRRDGGGAWSCPPELSAICRLLEARMLAVRIYAGRGLIGSKLPHRRVLWGAQRTHDARGRRYYRYTLDRLLGLLLYNVYDEGVDSSGEKILEASPPGGERGDGGDRRTLDTAREQS